MAKILRNDSSPAVDVVLKKTGATIEPGAPDQYVIDVSEYPLWASDDAIAEVTPHINSGDIVVNDGLRDLNAADGISHLKYPDDAFNIRFLSDPDRANAFAAKDVQRAIEEARVSGIGTVKPYPFATTGNTNNKWLGSYVPSTFSNDIPLIIPQNADMKGILFVNQDDDVDIDLQVFKNGTLVHTEEIRNKRFCYNVGFAGPSFSQGDRISVFLKKYTGGTGDQTAQDPVVTILVKFTAEAIATGGQQNGVT